MIERGLPPELTGDFDGIDPDRRPPGPLVAGAMDRAMMRAAERDGEFIAGLAAERPRLQVAKMMRSMASRRLYGRFLGGALRSNVVPV